MKINLRRTDLRILSFLLALVLAIPFPWKGLTGFYMWLNPFIMLNSPEPPVDYSGRRYFLMSEIGMLAGVTVPGFLKPPSEKMIRPPAAADPVLFSSLYCRCGNCIKACPTRILIHNTDINNLLAWMTPAVSFRQGYCLETCNICSRVCPSGAIALFSVEAKNQLFMGIAEVAVEDCYLSNNKECIKCRESCKYDAIEFVPEKNILNLIPAVDPEKCVGCGACEVICPAECVVIKPLKTEQTINTKKS